MNKRVISFIILFIESILFFIVSSLFLVRITLFSPSYIFNKLDSVDFYSKQYEEIKKEMSYYTNQSGFTDDILDDIFSVNDVKKHEKMVINNLYLGRSSSIDTAMIKERFSTKIEKYISDNNFQEVDQKELDDFVDKMASIYSDEIKFMNYIDKVSFMPKLIKYSTEVLSISLIIFIALVIVNKKVLHRKNYSVIFFSSAFLMIFLSFYITSHIDIKNIFIYSELVSSVIKLIVNDFSKISIVVPIMYFIIGLLLALISKGNDRVHKKS